MHLRDKQSAILLLAFFLAVSTAYAEHWSRFAVPTALAFPRTPAFPRISAPKRIFCGKPRFDPPSRRLF